MFRETCCLFFTHKATSFFYRKKICERMYSTECSFSVCLPSFPDSEVFYDLGLLRWMRPTGSLLQRRTWSLSSLWCRFERVVLLQLCVWQRSFLFFRLSFSSYLVLEKKTFNCCSCFLFIPKNVSFVVDFIIIFWEAFISFFLLWSNYHRRHHVV